MTQSELEHSLAATTGESILEIQRCGFSWADPDDVDFDPEPNDLPPQVVDWDELEQRRFECCVA